MLTCSSTTESNPRLDSTNAFTSPFISASISSIAGGKFSLTTVPVLPSLVPAFEVPSCGLCDIDPPAAVTFWSPPVCCCCCSREEEEEAMSSRREVAASSLRIKVVSGLSGSTGIGVLVL